MSRKVEWKGVNGASYFPLLNLLCVAGSGFDSNSRNLHFHYPHTGNDAKRVDFRNSTYNASKIRQKVENRSVSLGSQVPSTYPIISGKLKNTTNKNTMYESPTNIYNYYAAIITIFVCPSTSTIDSR